MTTNTTSNTAVISVSSNINNKFTGKVYQWTDDGKQVIPFGHMKDMIRTLQESLEGIFTNFNILAAYWRSEDESGKEYRIEDLFLRDEEKLDNSQLKLKAKLSILENILTSAEELRIQPDFKSTPEEEVFEPIVKQMEEDNIPTELIDWVKSTMVEYWAQPLFN